jgi:exodeoxyribonuclease VII small subunit
MSAPLPQPSYEEIFAELEQVVALLEGENRPLEETLRLYERGQALAAQCAQLLQHAELKVRQLNGDLETDFIAEA